MFKGFVKFFLLVFVPLKHEGSNL